MWLKPGVLVPVIRTGHGTMRNVYQKCPEDVTEDRRTSSKEGTSVIMNDRLQ